MLYLALQFLVLSSAQASNQAVNQGTSKLMVHIPHTLYKSSGYQHREAMFGMPPYGGSIAQNVFFADDSLCSAQVNITKGYPKREHAGDPWPTPYILMIDRGECSFTTKVRNAQRVGASGVLIADNTCLCADEQCVSDLPCESSEPIMADDGSGADISIPSFLVFKRDADAIKNELMANQYVRAEMTWSLPAPDDRVEYDLWTVPGDPIAKDFLNNFKVLASFLNQRAYFTPHMYIYDGVRSNCLGRNGEDFCYNMCTNNGRYCATDPDGDLESGVSGADVVRESLRRICIWEHFGQQDGVGIKWWNYVEEFEKRCGTSDLFAKAGCIEEVFKAAGIPSEVIETCAEESGGTREDVSNVKLDMEIQKQDKRGVVVIPTVYVNEVPIRGSVSPANVFSAVCAGYAEGTEPVICKQCSHCPSPTDCINTGFCTNGWEHKMIRTMERREHGDITAHFYFLSMFFCMGGVVYMGVRYYNRVHDDMREHVRGILAEYIPLDDNGAIEVENPMEFGHSISTSPLVSEQSYSDEPHSAIS